MYQAITFQFVKRRIYKSRLHNVNGHVMFIVQVNIITDKDDNEWIQAFKKEGR